MSMPVWTGYWPRSQRTTIFGQDNPVPNAMGRYSLARSHLEKSEQASHVKTSSYTAKPAHSRKVRNDFRVNAHC